MSSCQGYKENNVAVVVIIIVAVVAIIECKGTYRLTVLSEEVVIDRRLLILQLLPCCCRLLFRTRFHSAILMVIMCQKVKVENYGKSGVGLLPVFCVASENEQ